MPVGHDKVTARGQAEVQKAVFFGHAPSAGHGQEISPRIEGVAVPAQTRVFQRRVRNDAVKGFQRTGQELCAKLTRQHCFYARVVRNKITVLEGRNFGGSVMQEGGLHPRMRTANDEHRGSPERELAHDVSKRYSGADTVRSLQGPGGNLTDRFVDIVLLPNVTRFPQ